MAREEWVLLPPAQVPATALALVLAVILAIGYFQFRYPKLNVPVATVVKGDWKATLLKATTEVRDFAPQGFMSNLLKRISL